MTALAILGESRAVISSHLVLHLLHSRIECLWEMGQGVQDSHSHTFQIP